MKLQTGQCLVEGHEAVAGYLEGAVEELLSSPADICPMAQASLLQEVKPVFTTQDNERLNKAPTEKEVKRVLLIPI